MAQKNIKPDKKQPDVKAGYNPDQSSDEGKVWVEYKFRQTELFGSRKNVYGIDIDAKMREWDEKYFNRVANIPPSQLDPDQRPVAINNAFGKVQTAISILLTNQLDYQLDERLQKYTANRELIRSLLQKSWRRTDSYYQFLLMVFNTAKRGWGVGRTFHRLIETDARFLVGYKDNGTPIYENRAVKKMDDVGLLALDNHNVWIDEETRPYDFYSTRDWMWREVWHIDKVRSTFPVDEYPNMKFVQAGGNVQERRDGNQTTVEAQTQATAKEQKKGMTELFFYESQYKDQLIVEINGVMVVWEPLPQDHKRISLALIPGWNLRGAETIYNIGIIEAMETDETLIDRFANLTFRQLLMAIAPPGFYSGTEDLENENIRLQAGVLRRTMNPQDIKFVPIPGPNPQGMAMIEWLENKSEQRTGITKTIEGDIANIRSSESVFALGLSKEAGLKRLSLPLKSLQYCLSWEARNRADLIKQVYSVFEVEHLEDAEEIQAYLNEVEADPAFYFIENEGVKGKEKFFVNRFRESQFNLEQNENGEFLESENLKFFKIRPEMLSWEGDIWVDAEKMLITSAELEKLDIIRLGNLISPLIQDGDPTKVGKFVKQILSAFKKDPKKWLPQEWLQTLYPVTTAKQSVDTAQRSGQVTTPQGGIRNALGDFAARFSSGINAINPFGQRNR